MKQRLSNIRKRCIDQLLKSKDFDTAYLVLNEFNDAVLDSLKQSSSSDIGGAALVGLGSLSLKKLAPFSDIDLLLLHEPNSPPSEDLRRFIYKLFDTDFDITISTRTISETIDICTNSYKTLFGISTPMYISGNKDLFDEFYLKFNGILASQNILDASIPVLFENAARAMNYPQTVVIPHLKKSPGAYRELAIISTFFTFLRDKIQLNVDISNILKKINENLEFIYVLRSFIHAFSGRRHEVLNVDLALAIGKIVNLNESALRKRVSLALRDNLVVYRGILSAIGNLSDFWKNVFEKRFSKTPVSSSGIYSIVIPEENIETKFWSRELHNEIPEFKFIEGYVERVGFHVFTVDEHSIKSVIEFYRLVKADADSSFSFIREIAKAFDQKEREILLISLLLHDIGKGRGGDHHLRGSEIATDILKRYSFSDTDIKSVVYLIENHLLIYNAMTRRDIENQDVINKIASTMQGISGLNKLVVLTYCDLKATNPKSLNTWSLELLRTLYLRVRKHMEGDESYLDSNLIRQWAKENGRVFPKGLDTIISNLPSPYLRYHSPAQVYEIAILLDKMEESGGIQVSFKSETPVGFALLTIAMPEDKVGIFYNINTVLAQYGAYVIYASVHTMKNASVFDLFRVGGTVVEDRNKMEKMLSALKNVLANPKVEILDKKAAHRSSKRFRDTYFEIDFLQDAHHSYSELEFECSDRVNLLVDVSRVFVELGLNLTFAKISTFGKRAVDVFHLSRDGQKLDDKIKLKLREKLSDVFNNS